ncbi:hypothetical protein [uncultured Ruminococcus sp.]|uniref:hypothetical protein n=1 Tax=uncultured Ruminococcus sp. TaxID=165186 RepID=UPI002665F48B|nr:hypothetical protein [uncultured Ruminococcus sp.]
MRTKLLSTLVLSTTLIAAFSGCGSTATDSSQPKSKNNTTSSVVTTDTNNSGIIADGYVEPISFDNADAMLESEELRNYLEKYQMDIPQEKVKEYLLPDFSSDLKINNCSLSDVFLNYEVVNEQDNKIYYVEISFLNKITYEELCDQMGYSRFDTDPTACPVAETVTNYPEKKYTIVTNKYDEHILLSGVTKNDLDYSVTCSSDNVDDLMNFTDSINI